MNQCQLHKTKKHTVCDCRIKSLSRLSLLPCGHTSLMWTNGKGVCESPPPCPSHSPPLSSPAVPRGLCGVGRGGGGEGGGKAWIVLTVSSQRPCSDWALWEIWAAGPPSRWLLFSGTFSCSRPSGAIGVPLSTIWDPVASPGRTPMLGNNSGPSLGNSAVPSTHGRPPGRREILVPGRSPFGAEHAGLAP